MIWEYIFFAAVALFIYTRIPKPQSQPPPNIKSINLPTADPSRDIPVIFGTVDIEAPNVVWYGDMVVEPIYEEAGGKK